MSKTMSDDQARAKLQSMGLDPDAPALVTIPKPGSTQDVRLAPDGVDPRLMPVTDIQWDERLLEGFNLDDVDDRNRAQRKVFDLYKAYGRNRDRNSLLNSQITMWIGRVRKARRADLPSGHVKDHVRQTKEQRDLLDTLAALGIKSIEDLTNLKEKA